MPLRHHPNHLPCYRWHFPKGQMEYLRPILGARPLGRAFFLVTWPDGNRPPSIFIRTRIRNHFPEKLDRILRGHSIRIVNVAIPGRIHSLGIRMEGSAAPSAGPNIIMPKGTTETRRPSARNVEPPFFSRTPGVFQQPGGTGWIVDLCLQPALCRRP